MTENSDYVVKWAWCKAFSTFLKLVDGFKLIICGTFNLLK